MCWSQDLGHDQSCWSCPLVPFQSGSSHFSEDCWCSCFQLFQAPMAATCWLRHLRWPCLDTSNLQKRWHRWWLRFHPKCIGVDMSWPEVTIEFFEIFWNILLKSFEACFSFFLQQLNGATICNRFRNSSLFVQWSGPWILQHFQRTSFWSSLARRFSQTWTTDDHGSYHGTRCLADLGQVGIAVGAVLASVLKHVACTGHKAVSLMAVSPSDILWQGIITMMYTVINHN